MIPGHVPLSRSVLGALLIVAASARVGAQAGRLPPVRSGDAVIRKMLATYRNLSFLAETLRVRNLVTGKGATASVVLAGTAYYMRFNAGADTLVAVSDGERSYTQDKPPLGPVREDASPMAARDALSTGTFMVSGALAVIGNVLWPEDLGELLGPSQTSRIVGTLKYAGENCDVIEWDGAQRSRQGTLRARAHMVIGQTSHMLYEVVAGLVDGGTWTRAEIETVVPGTIVTRAAPIVAAPGPPKPPAAPRNPRQR